MLSQERKDTVLSLCTSLIRERSYSGEENKVAEVMAGFCRENGFDFIETDRYGNCVCGIKGKGAGPRVLFDGHIDTVPVPDKSAWKHDPFGAEIVDGKMYGRGTSDMKGAVAAMLAAAAFFAEQTDREFNGEICVAGVVHEECFEGVAAREISKNWNPDYVVIGEATNLDLKIGQRGRGELVVETFGVPAHSANPQKGVNAVYKMMKVVQALQGYEPPVHPFLGPGIMELTDIVSSPYPGASVVPDYCRATYDRRLLAGETKESVLEGIEAILEPLKEEDPDLKVKVSFARGEERCYTGETIEGERFFPGWVFSEKEDFIQKVYGELKAEGFSPAITKYDFCTNGSHYAGEAGIKTIGIGPSLETLAHTIDEYIELDQLYGAVSSYLAVMRALTK